MTHPLIARAAGAVLAGPARSAARWRLDHGALRLDRPDPAGPAVGIFMPLAAPRRPAAADTLWGA